VAPPLLEDWWDDAGGTSDTTAMSDSFSPIFCSVDRWKDIGSEEEAVVEPLAALLLPVIVVAGLPALAVSLESWTWRTRKKLSKEESKEETQQVSN